MILFLSLFINLLPLYALIGIGYLAGKFWEIDRYTLANLAVYVCGPIVIFGFIAQLQLQLSYAALPFIAFAILVITGFVFYNLGQTVYPDNRANLLAMCASHGNTGYFGLPLVLILFSAEWVALYMFMLLAAAIYEGTVSYYFAARGKFSVRESVERLSKFPVIYAVLAGLAVNLAGWGGDLPPLFLTYWVYFKGAYVVVGMMVIGTALSRVPRLVISWRFLGLSFAGKFFFSPGLVMCFVLLDNLALHLYSVEVHKLLLILSLVPPGANIVAFATQMDIRPDKAATTVLLGTVFALFYIPLVFMVL